MIPHFDPAIGWFYTSPRIINERGIKRKYTDRNNSQGLNPLLDIIWNSYSVRVRLMPEFRKFGNDVPW